MSAPVVMHYFTVADKTMLLKVEKRASSSAAQQQQQQQPPSPPKFSLPLDDRLVYFDWMSKNELRPTGAVNIVEDSFTFDLKDREIARRAWVELNAHRIRILSAAMQMPRVFHWALPYVKDIDGAVGQAISYFGDREISFFSQYDKLLITNRERINQGTRTYYAFVILECEFKRVSVHGIPVFVRLHLIAEENVHEQSSVVVSELEKKYVGILQRALLSENQMMRNPSELLTPNWKLSDEFVRSQSFIYWLGVDVDRSQASFFKLIQWLSEIGGISQRQFPFESINKSEVKREIDTSFACRQLVLTEGSQEYAPYPRTLVESFYNSLPVPRIIPPRLRQAYEKATVLLSLSDNANAANAAKASSSSSSAGVPAPLDTEMDKVFRFCATRLIGRAQPTGTLLNIARHLFGTDKDEFLGTLKNAIDFVPKDSQFNTLASLLRVNVSLWPYMCPLPDYNLSVLKNVFIVYWTGYFETHYEHGSRIVAGTEMLYNAVASAKGITTAMPDHVKAFFSSALRYLSICVNVYGLYNTKNGYPVDVDSLVDALPDDIMSQNLKHKFAKHAAYLASVGGSQPPAKLVDSRTDAAENVQWELRERIPLVVGNEVTNSERLFGSYLAWLKYTEENASNFETALHFVMPRNVSDLRGLSSAAAAAAVVQIYTFNLKLPVGLPEGLTNSVRGSKNALPNSLNSRRLQLCRSVPQSYSTGDGAVAYAYISANNLRPSLLPTAVRKAGGTALSTDNAALSTDSRCLSSTDVRMTQAEAEAAEGPTDIARIMAYGSSSDQRDVFAKRMIGKTLEEWTKPKECIPPLTGNVVYENLINLRYYDSMTALALAYYMLVFTWKYDTAPSTYTVLFAHIRTHDELQSRMTALTSRLWELLASDAPWTETRAFDVASLISIEILTDSENVASASQGTRQRVTHLTRWLVERLNTGYADTNTNHLVFANVIVRMHDTLAKDTGTNDPAPFVKVSAWLKSLFGAQQKKDTGTNDPAPFVKVSAGLKSLFGEQQKEQDEDDTTNMLNQSEKLLEYSAELSTLCRNLVQFQTNPENIARYSVRLHLNRLYSGFIQVAQGLRYFFVANSLLVNRSVVPALSSIGGTVSVARQSIGGDWLKAFSDLVIGDQTYQFNAEKAFSSGMNRNTWTVFDHTRLPEIMRNDKTRGHFSNLFFSGRAGEEEFDKHIVQQDTSSSESFESVPFKLNVEALLFDNVRFKLTEKEQKMDLSIFMTFVIEHVLEKRRAKSLPLRGVDVDLTVVKKLRSALAQRLILFEAQLRVASRLTKRGQDQTENIRMYAASCYVLYLDSANNRMYWVGIGDSSPLLVSFQIPEANRRANMFARYAERMRILSLSEKTRREPIVLDSLIADLSKHDTKAHAFIAEENVKTQITSVNRRIAALSDKIKTIREATNMIKVFKDAKVEQLEKEKTSLEHLLTFLLYVQLGDGLRTENNSQLFNAILNQTPVFARFLGMWRNSFEQLANAMDVIKETHKDDVMFMKIFEAVKKLVNLTSLVEKARESYLSVFFNNLPDDVNNERLLVEAFAGNTTSRGGRLCAYLDAQSETVTNLSVQLAFYKGRVPANEITMLDTAIKMISNPYENSFIRSAPELKVTLETLNARSAMAQEALYSYISASKGSRLAIFRGDQASSKKIENQKSFLSTGDATLETLTSTWLKSLLYNVDAGDFKFAEIDSSELPRIKLKLLNIDKKYIAAAWADYVAAPYEFMTKPCGSLRIVELPASAAAAAAAAAPLVRASNEVSQAHAKFVESVMTSVKSARFYMAELQIYTMKGMLGDAEETLAVKRVTKEIELQAARMDLAQLVNIDVNSLDPSETPINQDTYPRWRSANRLINRWPVLNMFAYGSAMALEELQIDKDAAIQLADYRVLAERRLHTIGNLYLKSDLHRVSRAAVARFLHGEGVPLSQAHAQAYMYDTSWSTALSQPIVEDDIHKSVRAGVVHLDDNVSFILSGSERFYEALRIDKQLVDRVFTQYVSAYFSKMRREAITAVLAEMRSSTPKSFFGPARSNFMTLSRSVNLRTAIVGKQAATDEKQNSDFSAFVKDLVTKLYTFETVTDAVLQVAIAEFSKDLKQFGDVLSALDNINDAAAKITQPGTLYSAENMHQYQMAVQEALVTAAKDVLEKRFDSVVYEQIVPKDAENVSTGKLVGITGEEKKKTYMSDVSVSILMFTTDQSRKADKSSMNMRVKGIIFALFHIISQAASSNNNSNSSAAIPVAGRQHFNPAMPVFAEHINEYLKTQWATL